MSMSKWSLFFVVLIIAGGLLINRQAPPTQPPTKPRQPDCYPGVTCGCQFIFHCTNENPMAYGPEAIVWRMEVNLALL